MLPFTSGILWGDCIKCPGLSLLLWCVFICIVAVQCNWPLIFYALSVTSASHEYLPTDTDHTFTHVVLCSGTIIWHWTCHIWSCPIKLILLTGVDSCMKAAGRQARCFCIEKAWNPQAPNGSERSCWSRPTQLICFLDFYLDTFDREHFPTELWLWESGQYEVSVNAWGCFFSAYPLPLESCLALGRFWLLGPRMIFGNIFPGTVEIQERMKLRKALSEIDCLGRLTGINQDPGWVCWNPFSSTVLDFHQSIQSQAFFCPFRICALKSFSEK